MRGASQDKEEVDDRRGGGRRELEIQGKGHTEAGSEDAGNGRYKGKRDRERGRVRGLVR